MGFFDNLVNKKRNLVKEQEDKLLEQCNGLRDLVNVKPYNYHQNDKELVLKRLSVIDYYLRKLEVQIQARYSKKKKTSVDEKRITKNAIIGKDVILLRNFVEKLSEENFEDEVPKLAFMFNGIYERILQLLKLERDSEKIYLAKKKID